MSTSSRAPRRLALFEKSVGLAEGVDGRHRCDHAVLDRKVDEAGVAIADDQHARGPVVLAAAVAAVEQAQEGRVGRAQFLAHLARRREAACRRRLEVVRRGRASN